ncbi:MAG: hypothetical protein CL789_01260 [Chloroflexi bacterium]|nr:hypothetical protein [Chloroflexota bacterium]HCU81458.1 hypothetical protein [Chloroflexota bacterium]
MAITIIVNPYANRWKCGTQIDTIDKLMQSSNVEYDILITNRKGHAKQLAFDAAKSGQRTIIAAGGDGTLNEVVNGILKHNPEHKFTDCTIGIIPLGTANDLANQLHIPSNIKDAIEIVSSGFTRTIDVGKVNGHYFINNSAIGLETEVTLENERMTKVQGPLRYLLAAILTILKRPSWQTNLVWNNGEYTGSLTLVSVGNSNRTGGMFYMTPNAIIDDGKLDFIYAPKLTRREMFLLLPQTLNGSHISNSAIHEHRTSNLQIHCDPPTTIQADGEIFSAATTDITYSINRQALHILVPKL